MKTKIITFTIAIFLMHHSLSARELSGVDLKDMNVMFLKEDYAGLIRSANNIFKRTRLSRSEKKEAYYLTGISYIKIGDFANARKEFQKILKLKGNEKREEAYIGIADSLFYGKEYKKAITAYEDVINMYPRSDKLSSIYFNLGRSYKIENNTEKANYYFREINRDYSTSFEAGKVEFVSDNKNDPRYYIIQLGAFKKLRNAKKLVRRLKRKRYDSYIQKVKSDSEVLYRVRGGKFASKHYATRLLKKFKKDRFSAKIIVE